MHSACLGLSQIPRKYSSIQFIETSHNFCRSSAMLSLPRTLQMLSDILQTCNIAFYTSAVKKLHQKYIFQLYNGLIFKIVENFFKGNTWPQILRQHSRLTLCVNFHIPGVCNFILMMKTKFGIYKGFDHEHRLQCQFTPSVIIHGQIP